MATQANQGFDLSQFQDLTELQSSDDEQDAIAAPGASQTVAKKMSDADNMYNHDNTEQNNNENAPIVSNPTDDGTEFDLSKFQDLAVLEDDYTERNRMHNAQQPAIATTNCHNMSHGVVDDHFDAAQFQDLAALESDDENDDEHGYVEQQSHTIDSIKAMKEKEVNSKLVIKRKEELLVTGYLRQCQNMYHIKILESDVVYACNVSYGSVRVKYKYKFGDITRGTIKIATKATKSAKKATKGYKFGDITRSVLRKMKKKDDHS